ncbi:Uncharacterised protein [Enterobacter cloacae]|nr:Uncharacterised protein [Enterobacter cloacae]
MGDLGDHLRIQSATAPVVAFADVAHARPGMAGPHSFTAAARHAASVTKFYCRNCLVHRTAGGDLDDKKVNGNDGPQRRDH